MERRSRPRNNGSPAVRTPRSAGLVVGAFAIAYERHGTIACLRASGELDLATAPQFRDAYARAQQDGPEILLIDLADVTFIDSTGLHALLDAHTQDEHQRLRIILSPVAARLIDVVKLRDRLPIIEG